MRAPGTARTSKLVLVLVTVMRPAAGWRLDEAGPLGIAHMATVGGLGDSALRAGLTFVPAAGMFALVSLNWRRLPARWQPSLPVAGFVANAVGLAALGVAARHGGWGLYVFGALAGAGMAAARGHHDVRRTSVARARGRGTGVAIPVVCQAWAGRTDWN